MGWIKNAIRHNVLIFAGGAIAYPAYRKTGEGVDRMKQLVIC